MPPRALIVPWLSMTALENEVVRSPKPLTVVFDSIVTVALDVYATMAAPLFASTTVPELVTPSPIEIEPFNVSEAPLPDRVIVGLLAPQFRSLLTKMSDELDRVRLWSRIMLVKVALPVLKS